MWYTPILERARSVGRSTSYDVRATDAAKTILWPEERAQARAALSLPGQLARVLGCEDDTNLAQELARIAPGERVHAAAIAHELRDATLSGGTLYGRKGLRMPLSSRASKLGSRGPLRHFERAVLCCSEYGTRYFGHFLTDDCTSALTAEHLGLPAVRIENAHPQARGYELAFELAVNVVEEAHFEQLLVITDIGQTSDKRRRYETLRRRLARQVEAPSSARGAFLRRGGGGTGRVLQNEAELEHALIAEGFVVVDPQHESLSSLWQKLASAPVVLGVEGSHLAHGLFSVRDRGALICIQPPRRFNNVFKDYTDCLKLSYGFVVAQPDGAGFRLERDELLRTIELVERSQRA